MCPISQKNNKGRDRLKLDKANSKIHPVISVCYLPDPFLLLFPFLSVSVVTNNYALCLFGFIKCFSIFVEQQGVTCIFLFL